MNAVLSTFTLLKLVKPGYFYCTLCDLQLLISAVASSSVVLARILYVTVYKITFACSDLNLKENLVC